MQVACCGSLRWSHALQIFNGWEHLNSINIWKCHSKWTKMQKMHENIIQHKSQPHRITYYQVAITRSYSLQYVEAILVDVSNSIVNDKLLYFTKRWQDWAQIATAGSVTGGHRCSVIGRPPTLTRSEAQTRAGDRSHKPYLLEVELGECVQPVGDLGDEEELVHEHHLGVALRVVLPQRRDVGQNVLPGTRHMNTLSMYTGLKHV